MQSSSKSTLFFFFPALGIDKFPGKLSHSWEYKDPDAFRGKRVVVVGIGNSGGDVAVDISRVAEKVSLESEQTLIVIFLGFNMI